jgi:hypothetical protein
MVKPKVIGAAEEGERGVGWRGMEERKPATSPGEVLLW